MTITTPPPETRRRRLRRGDASTRADDAEGATTTARRAASAKTAAAKTKVTPRDTTDGAPRGKAKPAGARPKGKGTAGARATTGGKTAGTSPGATAAKAAGARTATKRPVTRTGKTRTEPTRAPARRPAGTRPPRRAPRRPAPPRARAPFVLLIVGLLGGALVSLLLLNTVLAQDAFTLSELQRDNRQLAERRQALQADIARESDPKVLHDKARSLGMVDPQGAAFIDARTGRVTEVGSRPQGVSDEAVAAAAAGAVTGAPGAMVSPAVGAAPRQNTQKAAPKTAAPRQGGGTR